MYKGSAICLYAFAAASLLVPTSATAQFIPRNVGEPVAMGEGYRIEGSAGFWSPGADMTISSEALGIAGDEINFKKDLGLEDQRFRELHVVFKPTRRAKLRFQYIPIKYTQKAAVTRDITFNGQLYRVGVPIESTLSWKAYRFTYEYDFVSNERLFAGLLLEAKYTDVEATLDSPNSVSPTIHEFAHASAPIPAIGGIVRYYVMPNVSITGELSGVTIPDSISKKYNAHYADLDLYGTFNLTPNIGVKGGFRSFDVGYLVEDDSGSFTLNGIYFGLVARY
jgi:hypothetical protein